MGLGLRGPFWGVSGSKKPYGDIGHISLRSEMDKTIHMVVDIPEGEIGIRDNQMPNQSIYLLLLEVKLLSPKVYIFWKGFGWNFYSKVGGTGRNSFLTSTRTRLLG